MTLYNKILNPFEYVEKELQESITGNHYIHSSLDANATDLYICDLHFTVDFHSSGLGRKFLIGLLKPLERKKSFQE